MNIEKQIEEAMNDVLDTGAVSLVLDAESDDCSLRMSSFQNSIEEAMHNFQNWIMEHSLKPEDIWYADLFRIEGSHCQKHVASLSVEPDNVSVRLEPAPENSTLHPFGRRPGLKRRIRCLLAQFNQ